MEKFIPRFISFIVGLFILSFGVSLTIKSNIGAGAWDALNVGLSKFFFTVGTWVIIVGIILIIVNAILLKAKPDFLAIITIVIVGFFIDFWLIFVLEGVQVEETIQRYLVFFIGLMFMSVGIATYLQAKFPLVPIDNLMIAIQKRLNVSLRTAKTIGEVIAFILAFLVNGPIGIGTIFITFLIGPMIQFFFPKIEHIMSRFQRA